MLYPILRQITRIVLQGYYRKIFVNGEQKIPKDHGIILAVNHPSAFTEPCLLATHLDRELHFLIRGDIINPKIKWFFDQTNQLPIYRFQDGFSSMRQNEKQFSYCFDLLAKSGCIIIFAEGSTKHIKRTRPVQKGAARIAFGALQNRDLKDVLILPVGVNFESSPRPRSIVTVEIGDPISTRAHMGTYEADERQGLNDLTRDIFKGLKPQMININDDSRLEIADDLLLFAAHDGHYKMFPVAEHDKSTYFNSQNAMANKINNLSSDEWSSVSDLVINYKEKLANAGVSDNKFSGAKNRSVWWILLTPFALIGWLFLWPVQWISFALQHKLNQKDEYVSGFRMAGFLVFVPLFLLVWIILLWRLTAWWTLSLILVLPLLSLMAVWWLDAFKIWSEQKKWTRLTIEKRNELIEMRNQLMNSLN